MLHIENLHAYYGKSHVLHGVTFDVQPGEIVALLGRNPDKPRHELVIAAAGPLVNVAIIAVLLVLMPLLGIDLPSLVGGQPAPGLDTLVWWMLLANISLVLFNLIPAFPLDGGRMFRALLAMRMGNARATQIASRLGQLLAVGLGFVGLGGIPLGLEGVPLIGQGLHLVFEDEGKRDTRQRNRQRQDEENA